MVRFVLRKGTPEEQCAGERRPPEGAAGAQTRLPFMGDTFALARVRPASDFAAQFRSRTGESPDFGRSGTTRRWLRRPLFDSKREPLHT